jgi:argininosuccinate synthase
MTTRKSRIPDFKTVEEEAVWWDTHDPADYQDELKTVKVRFAKNLSVGLNIRLDPASLKQLRTVAHEKGIGPTTLVRMWVMEHLKAAH